MANPQNTPSDQDMNVTENNPNMGNVADDMDAGAQVPRPNRMGSTPMQSDDDMGATEPIAYEEETDILFEVPDESGSGYTATPDRRDGTPQGTTPSSTGLEGAGTREPGGQGIDTANSGVAGTENSPSNSGVEGQGVDEDGGTVPRNA
jgi:hypothetical protein